MNELFDLISSVDPGFFTALLIFGFMGVMYVLTRVLNAIRQHENVKKNERVLSLVGTYAGMIIFTVAFGDIDLSEYEVQASERELEGQTYIDARMLYVIDRVEKHAKQYGIKLDIEDAWGIAERTYQGLLNEGRI